MTDRTALVTGASSGLGAHFARVLAADEMRVILAARRLDRAEEQAAAIRDSGGVAQAIEMDVTNADQVAQAVAGIAGRLDVLINNAGIAETAPALTMSPAGFAGVIDTNLLGVFHVAQAAGQRMRAEGGGTIVNIASILGLRVAGGLAAYAASKAAVVSLTKTLALEWARHGIRVNALCPGYIETPLNAAFFASDAGKALIARIPQRRLGQVSDLDAPLRLLAGEGGGYITGATLAVDGGHLVSGL